MQKSWYIYPLIRWLLLYICIIIMSHCQHGSPWLSPANLLYRPLLPVGLQGYILYWHSCCIEVLADHPVFACPCEGVHRSILLMNSSLLLQQCPACLVHLTWIVFMMGGRWSYSCCFVRCCLQNLFNIAHNILV